MNHHPFRVSIEKVDTTFTRNLAIRQAFVVTSSKGLAFAFVPALFVASHIPNHVPGGYRDRGWFWNGQGDEEPPWAGLHLDALHSGPCLRIPHSSPCGSQRPSSRRYFFH